MIVQNNEHFREFVSQMDTLLRGIESSDGRTQNEMMNKLFHLEDRFRMMLVSTVKGRMMYARFMRFILEEKGNILHTRIYFRERQDAFDKISVAFTKSRPDLLYKLKVNYVFCNWVIKRYPGTPRKELVRVFDEIVETRKLVCTEALPSAIHQAKIFYHMILSTHLDYMDMVQNATEGLMNAIDKFDPTVGSKFGNVIVGRMKERIMDDHNSTLVKIPSKDKRILYRANSARNKKKLTTDDDIEKYVRESFKDATKEEIGHIANAANSVVSLDSPVKSNEDSNTKTLRDFVPSQERNQEEALVEADLTNRLNNGMLLLTVIENKVTVLKTGQPGG